MGESRDARVRDALTGGLKEGVSDREEPACIPGKNVGSRDDMVMNNISYSSTDDMSTTARNRTLSIDACHAMLPNGDNSHVAASQEGRGDGVVCL